jgi:F420-dependent oxidoreductase-like protein
MFTLADHFFQMEAMGRAQDPFLEVYTTLGYLAGRTRTIALAPLVTGVTYRHPGLLAKTATTVDVLSGGRLVFGIGAAWYEREHLALGVPYPPVRERFEMLEETLQICQQMWSDDDGPYEGKHYRLAETICEPQPIRRPPILIGGLGEKKTLRLVAQYADVWNATASSVEELAHKIEVLHRHCETVGRDPAEIRLTAALFHNPFEDVDAYVATAESYAKLGVDQINAGPVPFEPDPVGFIKRLGDEVIPRLAQIG